MRLWHKDLIPYLPRQQLLSQYRECCCIAKSISEKDTPNHILVNKIMYYPIDHFYIYTSMVADEMEKRGYKCNWDKFHKWLQKEVTCTTIDSLFKFWHNQRYLIQCYYNLQEKYDCGGITDDEWQRIEDKFGDICNGVYNR